MPAQKVDLSDVTFAIPFRLDSEDRARNLRIVVSYLLGHFETNILIAEHDATSRLASVWREEQPPAVDHVFLPSDAPYFPRARCTNVLAQKAETPLLVIQDVDALLPLGNYEAAAERLRAGTCDLCFPFENRVMWIPNDAVPAVEEALSVEGLAEKSFRVSDETDTIVSLVVFLSRQAFLAAGMLNEHFKSWGYEDVEFYERFTKLGYRTSRLSGLVYHLNHHRGENWGHNPFFEHNRREYEKVCAMSREELSDYVRSWPWHKAALPAPQP